MSLFRNDGKGKMVDASNQSGEVFAEKHWARDKVRGALKTSGASLVSIHAPRRSIMLGTSSGVEQVDFP